MTKPRTLFRTLAALIGWFAVIMQYPLMLELSQMRPQPMATVDYLSFFTIQTNILAALAMTLWARWPMWDAAPLRGAVLLYILIVAVVYHLLLAPLVSFSGLMWWVDQMLHSLLPAMFLADWLLFSNRRGLAWRHLGPWLVFPLVYCAYTLLRGGLGGWYPYPFLDPLSSGWTHVLGMIGVLVLAFVGLGVLIVLAARRWPDPPWAGSRG